MKATDLISKKILHPKFLECAKLTNDPYWIQVFEDCSRGRFPKGSCMDSTNTSVYIKNVKINQSYKLTGIIPQDFLALKKLFREILHLGSVQDRKEITNEIDGLKDRISLTYNKEWKDIRKKNIKDYIIRTFILDLKKEFNLTHEKTTQLSRLIKLGFLFNWINNENVVYENKNILEIKNLIFDESLNQFDIEVDNTISKREYKPKLLKLSGIWKNANINTINSYIL